MWRVSCLLAVVGTFAATSPASSAPESFLLRVKTNVYAASLCDRSEGEELVFRDGLVVESSRSETGIIRLSRRRAPAAAIEDLAAALARDRVGHQEGGCEVDFSSPGAFHEFTITWFGNGGRRNTFAITSAGGRTPCPPSTQDLFAAIQAFEEATSRDPAAQQAEVRFPPVAFCGSVQPPAP